MNEQHPQADPRLQALLEQVENILLVLERPVVQRQLVAFVLLLVAAWLIPRLVHQLLRRLAPRHLTPSDGGVATTTWSARLLQWVRAIEFTLFPLLGLFLGELAIHLFAARGWRFGLIERFVPIFWLLLAYQSIVGVLYGFLVMERAKHYQRRFLLPLFLILTTFILGNILAGTFPLAALVIFTLFDQPLTIGSLFSAVVSLYVFFTLAWLANETLGRVILPSTTADPGVSNAILTTSRYAIIAIGILTAISTLGVDLSALTIIGGGLSVGLGFGLQELVANFVSGILLLFERTLRPGDVIEIGGLRGVVDHFSIRSTVVRTPDNVAILIPNKSLLTSIVSTYTQMNRTVRQTMRVGVSYDSDPQQVRDLLLGVADRHGLVLKKPAPDVFFLGFGASTLDFELAVWVGDAMYAPKVTSDLYFMTWREFERFHIKIPYPQHEVHIHGAAPLTTLATNDAAAEQIQLLRLP
jgi:small-conductance mechanosensitive channel